MWLAHPGMEGSLTHPHITFIKSIIIINSFVPSPLALALASHYKCFVSLVGREGTGHPPLIAAEAREEEENG